MKTHETDLPTQQIEAQKKVWISSPHEDDKRQKDHSPPSKSGSKKTLRFLKSQRLLKRREFQKVSYEGKRLVGRLFCLDILKAKEPRLGITASGKFGISPERNRFKRLMREAFRQNAHHLPPCDLNAVPRQLAKKASFQDIERELLRLLSCP